MYLQNEKQRASLKFYSLIGIPLLKRMIMGTIGKAVLLVNPKEKMPSYFIGSPYNVDSLLLTIKWLYFNEIVHLFLVLVTSSIGYFCWVRGYSGGVIIMAMAILLNVELALMQQMNRIRIKRTIKALRKRKTELI